MNYNVIVSVTGKVEIAVNAATPEEAKRKACEMVCDYDFGELRDIDWEAKSADLED